MINTYNCRDIYKYYYANGGTLTYKEFKTIIAEKHKRVCNIVISIGYEYKLPFTWIRVVRNPRNIKITENGTISGAVDWKASKKLKEEILSRNGILYECKKDAVGNIIWDNGGEKWLVYRTDDFYYTFQGTASVNSHNSDCKNASKYHFKPTWDNQRNLIASLTEESELLYREKYGSGRHDFVKNVIAVNCNKV